MKKKEKTSTQIRQELFVRFPQLVCCRASFDEAFRTLLDCYRKGGKLLVAGNGGSAADSEHIVGELMKSFLFHRKISDEIESNLVEYFGEGGAQLAGKLEGALPAIPMTSMPALTSAFANDVDAAVSFAQMLFGYGCAGDVFLGISLWEIHKNLGNRMKPGVPAHGASRFTTQLPLLQDNLPLNYHFCKTGRALICQPNRERNPPYRIPIRRFPFIRAEHRAGAWSSHRGIPDRTQRGRICRERA